MRFTTTLFALVMSGMLAGATYATAEDDAGLASQAKISQADAEKTALAKVPRGKVKETELEKEDGLLVWCVDIERAGSKEKTEVLVDAKTGKVVSAVAESDEDEDNEGEGHEEDGEDDGHHDDEEDDG